MRMLLSQQNLIRGHDAGLEGSPFERRKYSSTCVLASLPQRRPFSVSSPQTSFVSHQHRSETGLGNCRLAKPRTTIPSQPLTPKLATMLAVKRFRICSLILQQLGSKVPRNRFPTDSKGGRLEIYSEGGWSHRPTLFWVGPAGKYRTLFVGHSLLGLEEQTGSNSHLCVLVR